MTSRRRLALDFTRRYGACTKPYSETRRVATRASRSGRCSGPRASRSGTCGRSGSLWTSRTSIGARSRVRPPAPSAERRRRWVRPGQRVRLVHELRELRRAEELLQRRHDRADVDDRLRRDRVDVLGRHPLADDALHAVEADAERLLDELADRAQAAVAEVLVLVELVRDRIALEVARVLGVVLRVVGTPSMSAARRACARAQDVARGEHAHVHRDRRLAACVSSQPCRRRLSL